MDDARNMLDHIQKGSVHLAVWSPPYCVGKAYEKEQSLEEWRIVLADIIQRVYDVLVPGGRIAINVANIGRKPYRPMTPMIWQMLSDARFEARGEIIWTKAVSVGPSTAWGSWRRPTAPTLRDVHEYILIGQKPGSYPKRSGLSDITVEEFTHYTQSIWSFQTASAKQVGHEAPFPLELPHRLIKLYTWPSDTVLDPMCGSGTTLLAAKNLERSYIGIDNDQAACALADQYLNGLRKRNR